MGPCGSAMCHGDLRPTDPILLPRDWLMTNEASFWFPSGVAGLPSDLDSRGVRRDAEGQAALKTHLAA